MFYKKIFINNFLFLNWNYFNLINIILREIITFKILMFAFFDYKSFYKNFLNKFCNYYSRSKNFFWFKGKYSKNFQILKNFFIDCDMDFFIFNIIQFYKITCHTKNYFCNFNKIY
ncbi:hypothetical protein CU086_00390 [Candidatus Nasuia deltocephalinicola]|uniref:phosphoribosyl-AMP cyclohydrolase n=1 Tax=Candidatus Nasuia deltocephalincola TaxID=1160784 RepID=A0A974WPJ6_9PROT|nr:hypothetical protein CU086_00390 [Candidatus Nasuia deltocephalinicola]